MGSKTLYLLQNVPLISKLFESTKWSRYLNSFIESWLFWQQRMKKKKKEQIAFVNLVKTSLLFFFFETHEQSRRSSVLLVKCILLTCSLSCVLKIIVTKISFFLNSLQVTTWSCWFCLTFCAFWPSTVDR